MSKALYDYFPSKYLLIWLLSINLTLFLLVGLDKKQAKMHRWRISEKKLLWLGFLGGGAGGMLGMLVFHHKTKRWYFYFVYIIEMLFWILMIKILF